MLCKYVCVYLCMCVVNINGNVNGYIYVRCDNRKPTKDYVNWCDYVMQPTNKVCTCEHDMTICDVVTIHVYGS